ncbi:hypothetical protein PIB30_054696 [Stylosanthes scabra]|uniref:Uncharacterized protein n=1 Tax=Stylosanthes scabra TaxID=79078 RepID=A0ABU6VHS9_9FABA|nr:hypothetical protein [Stylosanthes scabra]
MKGEGAKGIKLKKSLSSLFYWHCSEDLNQNGMLPRLQLKMKACVQAQRFISTAAKTGAKVAKEGAKNEEIIKKSLEANSDAYPYAPMVTCVRIAKTWVSRLCWNRTL